MSGKKRGRRDSEDLDVGLADEICVHSPSNVSSAPVDLQRKNKQGKKKVESETLLCTNSQTL